MKHSSKLKIFLLSISSIAFSQQKPNILWITIEDTSPQFIGCYGNENAKTPEIDKLASEGVRFTNAFSTGTVCSPSRTAIITGVKTYKTGTGNHRSKYPVPDFIKGFPYYMKQNGYYVSNNVKTDYNVYDEPGFIKEAWHESSTKAGWWGRDNSQPFFSVFNYNDCHQSRTMTQPYDWYLENVLDLLPINERIPEDGFEMPPIYHDSPEMRKQHARVYNSLKLTDNKIGELLKKLEEDNLREQTIIFFFADHGEGIPRGKTNGIDMGYRVPFIIWFPEAFKHLSPWGTGGVVCDELISFEDLAPTLVSIAGGEIPGHLNGRALLGKGRSQPVNHLVLSSDRADNGIDMVRTITDGRFIYSRNFMPYMPELRYIRYMEIGEIKQQMRDDLKGGKLNDLQKSLFDIRQPEVLYDISNDLWETKNLVNNPSHKKQLKKMRKLLKSEVLKAKDVMFLPEYQIGLLSEYTTAWDYRLNKDSFNISSIFKAASLSGFRSPEIASTQMALLSNKNPVVRYWAIQGLLSQNPSDINMYASGINKAVSDPYPPVAVTASFLSYKLDENAIAEKSLMNFCASSNMDIALMAINFLLYIENNNQFIDTVEAVRANPNSTYNVKAACMDFLGKKGLVPNSKGYES